MARMPRNSTVPCVGLQDRVAGTIVAQTQREEIAMEREKTPSLGRREFLGALGAGAVAAGAMTPPAHAAAEKADTNSGALLKIIDFHNHYVGPSFSLTTLNGVPPALRQYWEGVNRNLADPGALISSIETAEIAGRVINTPTALIQDADGNVAPGTVQRINDHIAELVGKNPGRLYGLATVDTFGGEASARELIRSVRELGLRGVFVESAKRDLLPDAPQARPVLAAAAALGVPVFVHPVTDPQMHNRFKRYGRLGVRLARSSINSAALFAMLEGGVFDELPNLRVVVTTLAIGGVLLAGGFGDGNRLRSDTPAASRRQVYIDTMGLHPALLRSAVDLLGADHVLMGTDWPIAVEKSVPDRLQKAFAACGLSAAEQQMIASGNTLRLLGVAS
jgi:aminocarboxymuconate-semialdehyde decarboxylase